MMEDMQVVNAMPYLNRYALMLTRNKSDADDLVSMTIIKALEIVRFQNVYINKTNPYLARIMRNTFISEFCRKKKTTPIDDVCVVTAPRQENVVYLTEIMRKVDSLAMNDKRIIQAHIDGKAAIDISHKLRGYRTSPATVQKIIRNFKQEIAA